MPSHTSQSRLTFSLDGIVGLYSWIFLSRCGTYSRTGRPGFSSELDGGAFYPKAMDIPPSCGPQLSPATSAGRRYCGPRSIIAAPLAHRLERRSYKPLGDGSIPTGLILPLRISALWRKYSGPRGRADGCALHVGSVRILRVIGSSNAKLRQVISRNIRIQWRQRLLLDSGFSKSGRRVRQPKVLTTHFPALFGF